MIEDIFEVLIKSLTEIGNTKRVKQISEPNVSAPLKLQEWMVKRTLLSLKLFQEEITRREKSGK